MRRASVLLGGGLAYIAIGLIAWWHVWTGGAAQTLTMNGWGDPAQQIWFVEWVPHAIGAGLDPFVSHAMFAPRGINLMANSSILFPAFAISPVTVMFGPVVAFNVLVVLAPAMSALVAWLVFRRYTTFNFGAWLGALFYGYSPFVLNDLADGHLHVTTLVFPPLVLLLLDDLAVSRRGSPVSRGILLGLVLAAQALTSLEVLAMVVLIGAIGIMALAVRYPGEIGHRWRRLAIGLGATTLTAGALLAWPFEVLLLGPRRFGGSIFVAPETFVVRLEALVWPGGGFPPRVSAAYIGIPLLLLFVLGAWRLRSGVLRLAAFLALVALVFAMGRSVQVNANVGTGVPLPDRLITHQPFLENLLPVRFMVVVDLLVALGLAVILGAVRDWLASRPKMRSGVPSVAAGVLGVLALASPALSAQWPYSTRHISVPAVYRSPSLTHLPPGSILLAYPVMNGFAADPMIWQAVEGMPYDMVAGYGFIPSGGPNPIGSLPASPVTNLFGDAQIGLLAPAVSDATERAVRHEIESWQVSDIVVLDTGKQPGNLVRVLTATVDRAPERIDGAWVWLDLRRPGRPALGYAGARLSSPTDGRNAPSRAREA